MLVAASYNLITVRQRLSGERLAPYEKVAGGLPGALDLYEWNMEASAAFHGLLHGVEVVLRNAIHEQMTAAHRQSGLQGNWFDDPTGLLEPRLHGHIAEARRRIASQGRQATPDRMVSELMFGFWRYLLASRYEQTLWTPALRHAFPGLQPQRRSEAARRVERLHHLRNRIAHYEPIHPRRLDLDYQDAIRVVEAICPDSRVWLEETTLVGRTMLRRPFVLS